MLLKSLQELPVFQSQRPTTWLVGQEKSLGTTQLALIFEFIVFAASDVDHA
jgi:hypothetical protein